MEAKNNYFRIEFRKRLYQFTLDLVALIDRLPSDLPSRRMSDQLLRSGTSIIANITEGSSATTTKVFVNYLCIALRSGNESKLWLCLLRDTGRASAERINPLLEELKELTSILATSIIKLKKKQDGSSRSRKNSVLNSDVKEN